jgi:hypothetical protein
MTRRVPQRILLSFVCALALILIPMSYSALAQSTTQSQDRIDRNDVNQNQSNQDLNKTQSDQSAPDVNSSTNPPTDMRQKPSSSETDPNSQYQNQNQNQNRNMQNQNRTDTNTTQSTTESQSTTTRSKTRSDNTQNTEQNTDQNKSTGDRNLPSTAGELPLLALIGLLSLGAAAGTRVLARVRR